MATQNRIKTVFTLAAMAVPILVFSAAGSFGKPVIDYSRPLAVR